MRWLHEILLEEKFFRALAIDREKCRARGAKRADGDSALSSCGDMNIHL